MTDVIVIGGGAAGLLAAATAAKQGSRTLLLEKNERMGRKLLITGKGRCNITNDSSVNTLLANIPTNPKFLYSAFSHFDSADAIAFFESLGVPTKTERGSRVFPQSDKAADVVAALEDYAGKTGVEVAVKTVSELLVKDGAIAGVRCADGHAYTAAKVIVATGGLSYPSTGSTGDGYVLARKVGHSVTELRPSLVPIVSNGGRCKSLQGLSLRNVTLRLYDGKKNKVIFEELGEMLFTHFGVSGPLVLSASAHIREWEPNRYRFLIDLKPGLSEQQLDNRILRDFHKYINKELVNGLSELLPKKIISVIIDVAELSPILPINQMTKEMRQSLLHAIKSFVIPIDGFRPIDEAIITSGGIAVKEINPKTMESKLVKGLYFAGEVIDVDGYTGGFNLQIAFATGYLAGSNAGQRNGEEE